MKLTTMDVAMLLLFGVLSLQVWLFLLPAALYAALFVAGWNPPVLRTVPGFRSRTRWKVAVAGTVYLLILRAAATLFLP